MTPNFSLILDHDGISLLYLQGDAWRSLGAVSLDAADFDAQLDALRARAEGLTGGVPLRCTLVLPNSQILYTSAEAGKDARENARLAGRSLDGATPYALQELVFDWKIRGKDILIAAVARETLEEAEGFAQLHGFGPLSFTAAPEDGSFPGAPFFGPSDAAPRLLAPGETLERITRPILSAGPYEEPPEPPATMQASVPETKETPPPKSVDSPPEPAPVPEPEMENAPSDTSVQMPKLEPAEPPTVAFSSLRSAEGASENEAFVAPSAPAPEPVPETPEMKAEPQGKDAPDAAAAVTFSSIRPRVEPPVTASKTGARTPDVATDAASGQNKAPVSGKQAPAAKAAEKATRKQGGHILRAERKPSAAPATPPRQARPVTGADKALSAAKAAPTKSDAISDGDSGFRVPPAPPPLNEAEALTVFGARKSQQPQKSPGRLALVAAAGGAIVVGLVGLWALLGSGDDEFAASDAPAELITEAPAAPQPISTETAALPDLATTESAPNAISLAPVGGTPEPESDVAVPDGADTGMETQETARVSGAAALPPSAADAGPEDLTQPAIQNEARTVGLTEQDTLASLSTRTQPLGNSSAAQSGDTLAESLPEDSIAASMEVDPTPLDPMEALAAYTVSGIWQRAPERSQQALEGETEEYYIASIDPSIPSQDAYALPLLDRAPDGPPRAAATPIVPEPEPAQESGALTETTPQDGAEIAPGGVEIVRGKPSIIPPRRPDGLAPNVQTAPETGGNPAEDILRGERPRTRPEGLIEANERATFGGNTRSELAEIRPNARPRSVQETADALDAAVRMADAETVEGQQAGASQSLQDQALAIDLETATRRAIANSPQPRLRPSNISQIADRARKRAETEAQALAEAQQQAREAAEAAALREERAEAAAARKAAEEAAAQEAAKQAAAAAAAKAAEEEEKAARNTGPAVPRNERAKPTGQTSAAVAKQATVKNQISLSKVSLIGVYGTSTTRRALVRLPSGKMVKVKVGDRIDGGRVAAIGTNDLRYQKGGRTVTLKMPKG